jgi:heme exporter protein B
MFSAVLNQTISLAFRKGGGAMGALAFYVIVFTLFTFALGPEGMARDALAVMCVALLLSSVIAVPHIFERDYDDGMIEQYMLQPTMLELLVGAKLLATWVVQLLPILLIAPLLCLMAGLDADVSSELLWRLFLLSPSMASIATLTAALTIGSKRGGVLPALISLPLSIPLIIFAASVDGSGAVLLLAAFAFASVPLSCFVSSALIRVVD